jgi:hypothetical protein
VGLGFVGEPKSSTPLLIDILRLADGELGEPEGACDPLERTK